MKQYDVIVIGGGPSGLMAAIAAGEQGADVLLIDKGNKLGPETRDFWGRPLQCDEPPSCGGNY